MTVGAHRSLTRRSPGLGGDVAGNVVARVAALAALLLVSLVVARTAGPAGVGVLVMLRLLPWLTGLLLGLGLYAAAPYFLSGPSREDQGYPTTLAAMAVCTGTVGGGLWVLAAPVLRHQFFPGLTPAVVALAGVTVLTQMLETTAKACSQGTGDLHGSNRIIVIEEVLFLPAYGLLIWSGVPTFAAMVLALVAGDVLNAAQGWARLVRRGFFRDRRRASWAHVQRVAQYGVRAQLGSLALLLNARLDFALVGAMVGPAQLGVYAIASRYAELLRLPALAMNYVLYPAYAREGAAAETNVRATLARAWWIPLAGAVPMALAAPVVLPLVYGDAFRAGVVPTWILLVGLAGGGITGVLTAFLSGNGRPGLASAAVGSGLVVTLALDLALIPPFGIKGAATASTVAYLTTAAALLLFFRAVTHRGDVAVRHVKTIDQRVLEVPR
jgi:O-antigen/teichoic acid export membrane protein